MKIAIIDDESDAIEYLMDILQQNFEFEHQIQYATTFHAGIKLLENDEFDFVFLDIHMPHGSGFDLLEQLSDPSFKLVFTTAHDEYAIKAFKYNAFDYLLKPIDPDDLIETVTRLINTQQPVIKEALPNLKSLEKLAIPYKTGFVYLLPSEIIYLEASGSYTYVFTEQERYVISKRLKLVESFLDKELFCRVHASYIVNISKIKFFSKNNGGEVTMDNNVIISVSRSRREELTKFF